MKNNYYCLICGNKLDPKIHYKPDELGHTSKKVARYQEELLSKVLKSMYVENKASGEKIYFQSICDLLDKG